MYLKETRRGASYARNKGLQMTKGKWIQFLDSDDILLPDKLKNQIRLIGKNKNYRNIGFIAASSYWEDVKGNRIICNPDENAWRGLMKSKLGNTCANLFNKEKLDEIGGWDSKLKSSQEYNLMFRLLKSGAICVIDKKPLTVIRERVSGQISKTNPKDNRMRYYKLRKEIFKYLSQSDNHDDKLKSEILQIYFDLIRINYRDDSKFYLDEYNRELKGYKPVKSAVTSCIYVKLFHFFGFKITEQIREILR